MNVARQDRQDAIEALERISTQYSVPAKLGQRIAFTEYGYSEGMIVGTNAANLIVQFDGTGETHVLHPTWKVEYLPTAQEKP